MKDLGSIIKRFRYAKDLTLSELCELMPEEVAPSYLSRIERNEMQPTFPRLIVLADLLGFSLDDLATELKGGAPAIPGKRECRNVPVISWVQAGGWTESSMTDPMADCDWIPGPSKCSSDAFALVVKGDSMTNPYGISFPDGSHIIVDPAAEPHNKSFVVAQLEGSDDATFKQLILDAPNTYLKPLNPQYPVLTVDREMRIIGTVVDTSLMNFLL